MMRIPRNLLAGLALVFLFGTLVRADGAIRGRITDDDGKAIASATVSLDGPQGVRVARADLDGHFAMYGLPWGYYVIRVTKSGFADTLALGVMIQNGHIFRLNCKLTSEGQEYAYRRYPIDETNATPVVRAGSIVYY